MALLTIRESVPSAMNRVIHRLHSQATDSVEAFDLVRSWMKDCLENHPRCERDFADMPLDPDIEPLLPSRIIDIVSGLDIEPKLIEGRESGIKAHYAALSHYWGPESKRTLTTTSENVHIYFSPCFPLEKPSPTFKDAMRVTRELGLRYLWINSLCIIQGNEDDWKKESAMMGTIYRNSKITIAATGASDSTQGCSIRQPYFDVVEIPIIASSQDQFRWFVTSRTSDSGPLTFEPLERRAWITQEWILPPRLIHYTQNQLVWSCRSMIENESGCEITQKGIRGIFADMDALDDFRMSPAIDLYWSWTKLVEHCTKRDLTYVLDRQVAIQGLTDEIQRGISLSRRRAIDDTCVFGIWRSKVPDQLLWRRSFMQHEKPLSRPAELFKFPSWSWMLVLGCVSMEEYTLKEKGYERLILSESQEMEIRTRCAKVWFYGRKDLKSLVRRNLGLTI